MTGLFPGLERLAKRANVELSGSDVTLPILSDADTGEKASIRCRNVRDISDADKVVETAEVLKLDGRSPTTAKLSKEIGHASAKSLCQVCGLYPITASEIASVPETVNTPQA